MAPTTKKPRSPTSARAAAPSSPHSSTNSNADLVILSSSDDDDDDRAAAASTTGNRNRRGPVYQRWSFSDAVQILTVLAAKRRQSGRVPSGSYVFRAFTQQQQYGDPPRLKRAKFTAHDVIKKVSYLKASFFKAVESGGPGDQNGDQIIYDLSRQVWGADDQE